MAGFLSSSATIQYNGLDFPPALSSRVSARPVYDSTGRLVKYIEKVFTIEFILHNGLYDLNQGSAILQPPPGTTGDTVDEYYPRIRELLEQPGRSFIFRDAGYGEFFEVLTSSSGSKHDVLFGPKPNVLLWESVGGNAAVHCIWSVVLHVVESARPSLRSGLTEASLSISWGINEAGISTRTVSGFIETTVVSPEQGLRISIPTADRFRNRINIEIPLGFTRTTQSYNLLPPGHILTFTIVDSEIPSDNVYFPGTVRPNVTYGVSSQNIGMTTWNARLSGSIETAAGVPRWFAWAAFIMLIQTKMRASTRGRITTTDGQGETCNRPSEIIVITDFSMQEQCYDRGTSFSIGWILATSIDTLIPASGMWDTVTGLSWEGYRSAMLTLARTWDDRGHAGMGQPNLPLINLGQPYLQAINIASPVLRGGAGGPQAVFNRSKCPPKESSWLVFQNAYEPITETNTVSHKPLTSAPPLQALAPLSPGGVFEPDETQTSEPILQQRSQHEYRLRMKGWAMRVCYSIPDPTRIDKYLGSTVTRVGKAKFKHQLLGMFDVPVYIASWEAEYVVHSPPKNDPTRTEHKEICLQ